MAAATAEQLQALRPYIAGAVADSRGEIEIYCPLHNDRQRSCSINPDKGVWCCHAGCGGGSLRQLVLQDDAWIPAAGRVQFQTTPSVGPTRTPEMSDVLRWHRKLLGDRDALDFLKQERGLGRTTVEQQLLGFDGRYYKLPVLSLMRRLWNVRTYNPQPKEGHSKIWNTRGMGKARLYPINALDRLELGEPVLFCEGEWDTLLALQTGISAVTRTDGAGKPWHDEWTAHFVGLHVYMCHDLDRAGADGDAEVGAALSEVALVRQCHLPGQRSEKNGYDLSDYLLASHPRFRLRKLAKLLSGATPLEA